MKKYSRMLSAAVMISTLGVKLFIWMYDKFFPLQYNHKNLDPSYKTGLDFSTVLDGNPSYSSISMTDLHFWDFFGVEKRHSPIL